LGAPCVAREAAYFKRSFLVERDGDHGWVVGDVGKKIK
jgi:hypothetical protein